MDRPNVEIVDIEQFLPPGVKEIIGQGSSCFIGLLNDRTVLKYPYLQDGRSRLETEAKLLEHIGPHHRVIESEGLIENGLMLRYAVNGPLDDYIVQHNELHTDQRLRLCVQIVEGIEHFHSKCVYHGDLRPGNILLDEHFNVKLADVQGMLRLKDGTIKLDGFAREKDMYFMPRAHDYLDTRTDLFACGSTIHFVMTGQVVFPDLQEQSLEHSEALEAEINRRFQERRYPQITHACTAVIQRCWRGDYASAEELLQDLKMLCRSSTHVT